MNVNIEKTNAVKDILEFSDGTKFELGFMPITVDGQVLHWEVDLLEQPSYMDLDDSLSATHRMPSSRYGVQYQIDLGIPREVNTKEQAKKRAQMWCELTWRYINHGDKF